MATKSPRAVALGKRARAENLSKEELSKIPRMGGLAGGHVREDALTDTRQSEIATKAAAAMWGKKAKTAK